MNDIPGEQGHLSVFDRRPGPNDDPRPKFGPQPLLDASRGPQIDASTVRLALVDDEGRRAYVALGETDDIYLLTIHARGAGACGAPRALLKNNGVVCLQRSSSSNGSYFAGIVGDEVTAVYVGDRKAALANNVFIADSMSPNERIVTVTDDGSRDVTAKPPPMIRPDPVELPRYHGEIEFGPGRRVTVEIDDIDVSEWRGVPRVLLLTTDTPEVSLVEIHLLDGPRAGNCAPAEFHVNSEAEPPAVFLGQAPFG